MLVSNKTKARKRKNAKHNMNLANESVFLLFSAM